MDHCLLTPGEVAFWKTRLKTPLASVDDGEKNLVLGIKRLS